LAWDQNFTVNCIKNLPKTSQLMHSVRSLRITNLDYSKLLKNDSENTFIFLDPPYDIKDNLYGNNGDMHRGFDHLKFYKDVNDCTHKWLITYNDNAALVERFEKYHQLPWDLQYTMKAAKRVLSDGSTAITKSGKKGKELLIANYPLTNPKFASTPA
jgi:DNA adenine methylase